MKLELELLLGMLVAQKQSQLVVAMPVVRHMPVVRPIPGQLAAALLEFHVASLKRSVNNVMTTSPTPSSYFVGFYTDVSWNPCNHRSHW